MNPAQRRFAAELFTHLSGLAMIVATFVWLAFQADSGYRPGWNLGFWFQLGFDFTMILPWCLGSYLLVRCRPTGFWWVYFALGLALMGWLLSNTPSFNTASIFTQVAPTFIGMLPIIVFAHLASRSLIPQQAAKPYPWTKWRIGGVALLLGSFLACSLGRRAHEASLAETLSLGITDYREGRAEEAMERWGRVINHSLPGSSNWAVAVFNTGISLREHHRYQEAISRFTELLASRVNDLEPGGSLMEIYRNYRHRACIEIATCHEKLGNRVAAVQYLCLARDVHQFKSWCGTCNWQDDEYIRKSIARLEAKVIIAGEK
jgi:tetratricopeptide (TPR) repeat protein